MYQITISTMWCTAKAGIGRITAKEVGSYSG